MWQSTAGPPDDVAACARAKEKCLLKPEAQEALWILAGPFCPRLDLLQGESYHQDDGCNGANAHRAPTQPRDETVDVLVRLSKMKDFSIMADFSLITAGISLARYGAQ